MSVKAAVMVEPGRIEVRSFERPQITDDAMLIKMISSGVCGTDVHIYRGHAKGIAFPIIPGHENAGVIVEVGKKAAVEMTVDREPLREGDRVAVCPAFNCGRCYYCKILYSKPWLCLNRRAYGFISCKDPPNILGGWSEYLYVLPGSTVHRVPENLPLEVAALAEPTSIASRSVSTAFRPGLPHLGDGFGPGASVVVQGAGPIGLITSAVSKLSGAGKVIVLDFIESRLKMAERFGADHTINLKEVDRLEDRVNTVMSLTNGVGADVVFECVGVPSAFAEGIEYPRRGGAFIEMGHYMDSGTVKINPRTICYKDLTIQGSWSSPHRSQFRLALAILASKAFPFEELITHRFGLEDAERGIEVSRRKEATKAIVVL